MNPSRREVLGHGLVLAGGFVTAGLGTVEAAPTTAPATGPATKPDPYVDAIFEAGPPPLPDEGSFTIAVLPDTQNYRDRNVAGFAAQTDWIVTNATERRIAAVLHLGDITNNNLPSQWATAKDAMSRLDGKVPYFMTTGNHDYNDGKVVDRTTGFNENFPLSKYKSFPTFGGVYDREPERMENSYHLFSVGGRDFVVICLEFGPRKDVVRWANDVAAKYAGREAILVTHAYMYFDDTRYDWKKFGKEQRWNPHGYQIATNSGDNVSDGQELWDNLVSKHENFILTINGHVLGDGLGRIVTQTPAGRDVHQVLVNYQMRPNGGDGWLRLLEFKADGRSIDVRDYSPTLNKQNVSKQNRFLMESSPIKKA